MTAKNDLPLDDAVKLLKKHAQNTQVSHLQNNTKDALKRQYVQSVLSPEIMRLICTKDVLIVITHFKN